MSAKEAILKEWLVAEYHDYAIQGSTCRSIMAQLGDSYDINDMASWLDFFNHPELAEKIYLEKGTKF
jgi:hypothetical protein